jgi:hypothetical protein
MADSSLPMAVISLYVLTFNCGCSLIDIDAFASQLFSGLTTSKLPDVVVLSLQEIAPIPHSLIGGSFLIPYFERFYHAVQEGARKASETTDDKPIYTPITARNLGMTGIMVFAKDPTSIQDIETAGVGVGALEMGNKGAVGARFTYQGNGTSTELTFVAAHLAAMENELKRRNEDWKNIVRGLVFSSTASGRKGSVTSLNGEERPLLSISPRDASIYKPTSHLFLAGDLNYRTSTMSPSHSDHIETFPQPHHDESSPNHFSSLFQNDQLNQERLAGRTCHGLIEASVTFPPTYKYDPTKPFPTEENPSKWHWVKYRWPSWCDRILYLDIPAWLSRNNPETKITVHKYTALPLFSTSDHRPVVSEFSVPLVPIPTPSEDEEGNDPRIHPPFDLDIDWKAKRDRARIFELVTGYSMYFTTTLEGGSMVISTVVGAIGAYIAIRALLEF